jgi:hypothetical protein
LVCAIFRQQRKDKEEILMLNAEPR